MLVAIALRAGLEPAAMAAVRPGQSFGIRRVARTEGREPSWRKRPQDIVFTQRRPGLGAGHDLGRLGAARSDEAGDAEDFARLYRVPGSRYSDPEFSWKYELPPAGISRSFRPLPSTRW